MLVLAIASVIAWGRAGNAQLRENWAAGQATSAPEVAHQIFNGICIGMLGLTGFECVPAYVSRIKLGRFPLVLRNLHIPAMVLMAGMMTLVLAVVPLGIVLEGANVLSALGQIAAGRWLRVWVVADAIIVLCGVGLAGLFSACELLEQLAQDRVIPQLFLKTMHYTGSAHISILAFISFCAVLYASSGASLSIVSKMYTLVWLCVMTLFPLSLLLLKFNRGRLPRPRRTSLWVIFGAFAIALIIICGNIAIAPMTAGYFAAYFLAVAIFFTATQNKTRLLGWVYWIYDQSPVLHTWRLTHRWGDWIIDTMTRLRKQPVCILTRTDEINHLFRMVLYVRQNEETSCLKIVHFHDDKRKGGLPLELEANAKILDEAFPEITIDLILVEDSFMPSTVAALAYRLQIPRSLMFMSCPGDYLPYSVDDFGTRIITL
ncbi:hypothetical protein PILCRDRAFT_820149 [Piloderma croceum F 1598]|uniref:Amino acid permease/ SLC12A domain-containing protein n=1 Tax=Piloderma croceum (strain F 1598) TaxID=765440 RepID=A0A0C3B980_PILCF|nr:hypothetical protein PILCRDRAFT_820149 [Piloderma croceum F 1598]